MLFQAMDDERRWKNIVMHLSEGIVAFDENLKVVYENNSLQSFLNIKRGDSDEKFERDLWIGMKKLKDLKHLGDHPLMHQLTGSGDVPLTEPGEVSISSYLRFIR